VVKAHSSGKPWMDRAVDLRVDDHPEPLRELQRLLDVLRAINLMIAGDAAMEKNDVETAMKEYTAAMKLASGNVEIGFWSALTLAQKGNVDLALPIFKKVFSVDKNWVELLRRLPKASIIPDNDAGRALLKRIIDEAAGR